MTKKLEIGSAFCPGQYNFLVDGGVPHPSPPSFKLFNIGSSSSSAWRSYRIVMMITKLKHHFPLIFSPGTTWWSCVAANRLFRVFKELCRGLTLTVVSYFWWNIYPSLKIFKWALAKTDTWILKLTLIWAMEIKYLCEYCSKMHFE